jgi:autotransporter-associated beta strand protein
MKSISKPNFFLLFAGSSLLAISSASAADGTWNGITGNWTDTTNPGGVWSGGIIANGADSTANFTGVDIAADQTITLNGNRTIGNIIFTDATTSSHNLTITGNTLTLDRTSGVPTVSVTQAGRQLSISSIVAGNDGIQKIGPGNLRLTAANTFTNGLAINAGTLFVNPASGVNPLSSGKLTIGDVTNTGAAAELLYIGTNGNNSFSNLIDVRGNGTATIRVLGYNPTFSGAINLGNNLNVISNNNGGSTIALTGGVTGTGNLVIQSNAANGTASSAITFSGSNPLNFTGTITNSGTTTSATASHTTISTVIDTNVTGITQNSANSNLILSGANTFTSNITINAGTLQANRSSSSANPTSGALGNAQALGRTVTINNGCTLNFNLGDVMGNGGSSPKLTLIANGGTIRNNNGNYFNVLGPVQLNGGTLSSFGGGAANFPSFALTGTVTVGGSAVSTISSSGTNSQMGIQSGAGTTFNVADAVSGSDLNVTAVLANWLDVATNHGVLIKTGAGTMTLSATNTYTGGTRIENGTLAMGANNPLPNSPVTIGAATLDAGTFDDTSIGTLDVTAATSTIHLGAGANLAFAASNAVDWAGGTLNLTGTLDFSGTATSSLRFGTSSSGLTAGQLLQISSPGWTNFALNASGYLTATSSGGNTDPTISNIANQSVPSGANTGAIAFTVGDAETPVGSLTLSVSANTNTTLVPNGNIVFGGSGANRTVTVTPVSGLSGSTNITIRVTDGGALFAEDIFTLTVTDNYLSWATANNVTGGLNGDHDNDGVENLVEYALVDGGERGVFSGNTITFTKRGAPYGTDLTYIIETSETLQAGSWADEVTHGPGLLISNPTISYTFTPGTPDKKFARLKVSSP